MSNLYERLAEAMLLKFLWVLGVVMRNSMVCNIQQSATRISGTPPIVSSRQGSEGRHWMISPRITIDVPLSTYVIPFALTTSEKCIDVRRRVKNYTL